MARRGLLKCEKGATAVEYALILAMIVLVMIVALSNVANRTIHMWDDVETKVTEA
ncbi:MAG: Flp family type IVb pilin [Pseudomonadota bacterium]|nr:Flp family type IVb pilin [Pseudomonadota bacterium]